MTDAPLTPPVADAATANPTGERERWAAFIGNVARPLSILIAAIGASAAGIIVALRVHDGNDGAFLMGAIYAGASALFIGKAVEVWKTNQAAASVEKAKAAMPTA
jgi:hypothetical protein